MPFCASARQGTGQLRRVPEEVPEPEGGEAEASQQVGSDSGVAESVEKVGIEPTKLCLQGSVASQRHPQVLLLVSASCHR